jgi:hypothetical protein
MLYTYWRNKTPDCRMSCSLRQLREFMGHAILLSLRMDDHPLAEVHLLLLPLSLRIVAEISTHSFPSKVRQLRSNVHTACSLEHLTRRLFCTSIFIFLFLVALYFPTIISAVHYVLPSYPSIDTLILFPIFSITVVHDVLPSYPSIGTLILFSYFLSSSSAWCTAL